MVRREGLLLVMTFTAWVQAFEVWLSHDIRSVTKLVDEQGGRVKPNQIATLSLCTRLSFDCRSLIIRILRETRELSPGYWISGLPSTIRTFVPTPSTESRRS